MKGLPFWGNSIGGKSFAVTRQRRLNCYVELRKDGDKEKVVVYGTPGLSLKFAIGTNSPSTPARGLFGGDSSFYAVVQNQFLSLDLNGNILFSGNIGSVQGLVSMAASGNQLVLVDGASAYLYNISGGTFTQISPWQATGAQTITYCQGFFFAEQPNSQKMWASNAYDGSTWNALAFQNCSQYPDNIAAVDNLLGNLVVFGQQHMEFWQNAGAAPFPFSPILGSTNEWGLAAIFSRAHVNQTIIFLGESPQGTRHFCQLNGLSVAQISTPDLDYILGTLKRFDDAVALSYVIDGHPMYQCTFPTDGRTFLYDCSTDIWSEVQTGISAGPARHQANLATYAIGTTLLSDYQNGNIYTMSSLQYTDNGTPIQREMISRHITQDTNVLGMDELILDMATGGTSSVTNPQIMLQVSKDNGHTWGMERWTSMGLKGKYLSRVAWRRIGSGRDIVLRIRQTDPVKFVLAGAKATLRERRQ